MADALAALRVVEGAVFVVNGVMGAEVTTTRLWERATELGLARMLFVNMLDRERADFFRALDSLKGAFGPHVVATEIPIGVEHELEGVIDLIDMKAYRYEGTERDNCTEIEIPEELRDQAQEYREKLMDEVAEVSDALMERYLEGEEISHDETVSALKTGVTDGHLFPVTCGAASRNLGINRLLDALVEDLPSPAKRGPIDLDGVMLEPDESKDTVAFVFKTLADPYAGRVNLFRVYQGVLKHDSQVFNCRAHVKERIGQLLVPQGKDNDHADEFGPGDIGAVAKLKETHAGDVLAQGRRYPAGPARDAAPGDGLRHRGQGEGRRGEDGPGLRRLQEEDPIDFHRDSQTGEQILAGITQVRGGDRRPHEGALRRRGRAAPAARALPRGDQVERQGRPLQEADGRTRPVRRLPHRDRAKPAGQRLRVRQRHQGRRDPGRLHPRGREGRRRPCAPARSPAFRCAT